ncbi:MAG: hypothetical protein SGPRY_003852, partial [Prymnesium sp.]
MAAVNAVRQLDVRAAHERALSVYNPLAEAGVKGKHAIEVYINVKDTNAANAQQITAFC